MLQLGTHRDVPVGPRAARRLWKVGPLDPVQFEPIPGRDGEVGLEAHVGAPGHVRGRHRAGGWGGGAAVLKKGGKAGMGI